MLFNAPEAVPIVVWLTFGLLLLQGAGMVIFAWISWSRYIRAHKELEVRVGRIERRLQI
jgi:hypothetical protein